MTGFMPYKGRSVEPGQLVRVYRNLHNGKFSIQDKATGLVLGHADEVTLAWGYFTVSESGRLRVVREGRKNVHAYAEGRYMAYKGWGDLTGQGNWRTVTYNPFKMSFFTLQDGSYATRTYSLVHLHGRVAFVRSN
jgi:hypothetical protein